MSEIGISFCVLFLLRILSENVDSSARAWEASQAGSLARLNQPTLKGMNGLPAALHPLQTKEFLLVVYHVGITKWTCACSGTHALVWGLVVLFLKARN